MRKKLLASVLTLTMVTAAFTGCGNDDSEGGSSEIHVVSREDGSGTRGAFEELMGIEETIEEAEVTNSTAVMLTTVQGDDLAIGYVSLGSLDTTKVNALKINGAEATVDNVKNGTYKVSRPFNIAVRDDLSDAGQDFINFILSTEGQAIVEEEHYIPLDSTVSYEKSDATGHVVVGGSSSVTPVMEKLIEAYEAINSDVDIDIQTTDSTTGMTGTIDGSLDIGMASRDLKDSEIQGGLTGIVIATDGIAVIVNKNNSLTDITPEQVMKIYTGEIKDWSELN